MMHYKLEDKQLPGNLFDSLPVNQQGDSPPPSTGNIFDSANLNPQKAQTPQQSTAMDMIDVMNRNFAKVAAGGVQLGLQAGSALGFDTSQAQQTLAQQQAIHERDYNQAMKNSPVAGTITDIGSKIGATIATPGNQAILAGQGANLAVRGLQAFGMGANTGGQGYVEDGSMKQRIDNALGEGLLSGVGQIGLEGAVKAGSMLANNKYVRAGVGRLFNTPVQEAAKSVDEGLLTTVGSATGNDTIQAAENVLSKVPFVGTKSAVQKQAAALKDHVTGVLDDLGIVGKSKIELGDELGSKIIAAKAQGRLAKDTAFGDALNYADKNKIGINISGAQDLALSKIKDITDKVRSGFSSAELGTSPAAKLLKDFATNEKVEVTGKLFDSLRKDVGNVIQGLKKGADDNNLLPVFQQIKSSLDDSLESAGVNNSIFAGKLAKARQVYKEEYAPFKNIPAFKKFTEGKMDTDELLNTIVSADRPILTNKIVSSLSPEGQKTFSSALVNKVAQGAINDQTGVMDLQMFNRGLGKLGETITALPKSERMKIEGIQQLLTRGDKLLHAAKGSENSIPSWLSGGTAVAAGLTGQLGNLMAIAAGSKVLSKVLTSEAVTRSLIKLAGGRLTTTGKDGIIKGVLKKIFNATVRKAAVPAAANSYLNRRQQQTPVQQPPVMSNQGVDKLGILG